MNQAFKEALDKKRIFHFSKAKALVDKELKVAFDDLTEANGGEFSKDGASLSINNAEEFIKKAKEALSRNV